MFSINEKEALWLARSSVNSIQRANAQFATEKNVKRDSDFSINKKRNRVYIVSPYSGKTEEEIAKNVEFAKKCCRQVVEEGKIPVASHLLFTQFLDDKNNKERELGLEFGLSLLEGCDEVYIFGSTISAGMKKEIDYAKNKRILIVYKK